MRTIYKICLLAVFSMGCLVGQAQRKNIIVSDDLSANSEILKVKMGAAWYGKIMKFDFGDYKIEKSKMGWTSTNQKSNLFNTKTESKSKNKFTFHLSNKTSDTAIVNAMTNILTKEIHSFELFPNFYLGSDELLSESHFFSSFITLSSNKEEVWELLIENTYGSEVHYKYEAFLKNDERIINIIPISSNRDGNDKRKFPALGYEFIENERSLCAVQYFGGGAFGLNKNIVWLKSDLESKMKLILAAAMTSLMEFKLQEVE